MTNACIRAARSSAKHAEFSHADRLVPVRQRPVPSIRLDSSSATQGDDGQMLASRTVVHREFETSTPSPIDLRIRSSARRPARPASSRFEARREARGRFAEIDLVRGSHIEPGVRTILVVPV